MTYDEAIKKLKRYEDYYVSVDPYAEDWQMMRDMTEMIKEIREFLEANENNLKSTHS